MAKLNNIELLAALEALRIKKPNDDYILRVASAIVAQNFGYKSRADWTEEVRKAGLLSYDPITEREEAETTYSDLMRRLDQ